MLLTETYIRITVTVLYADNIVADNCYTGTISCKLLVGGFGIILSRFNELVVKIKIVLLSFAQYSGRYK